MGLMEVTAAAIGLFALLQWFVMPHLRRALTQPRPIRPVRLIMAVILGNLVRSISLIAALTFGAILIILTAIPFAGHALSVSQLAKTFQTLSQLREKIESFDTTWSIATIGVLSIALWLSARRDATHQLSVAVDLAVEKLRANAASGNWLPLEPTPRMQQLEGYLATIQEAIRSLAAQPQSDNQQTEKLAKEAQALREEIGRLDAVRRLDIGGNLSALANPQRPQNRFAAVLVSAGLLQALSAVSKVVGMASLVLLAPALVTLSGNQLAESIAQASADIHRLVVAESLVDAERDWRRDQPPPAQPRVVTADDQTLIQQLSYQYQVFARLGAVAEYHVPADAFHLASTDVRRELLAHYAALRPDALEVHGGVPERQDEAALIMHAAGTGPDGPEAERFRERMMVLARSTPQSDWNAFTAKASAYLHAMAQPVGPRDVGQQLFAEVLNMGGSLTLDPGPGASALHALVADTVQPGDIAEQAMELMDVDIYRFVTGIRDFGTPSDAKSDLLAGVPRHGTDANQWARGVKANLVRLVASTNDDVRRTPPTLDERTPPETELRTALTAAHNAMSHAQDVETAVDMSDTVATYRDLFPGVLNDNTHTPRASLIRQFPGVADVVGSGVEEAMESFVRARSYAALRGFSKIGGVLIGLLPEGGHPPSITSLDWTDSAVGITLQLKRSDGKVLSYGPFRAPIVQSALAYAADGRQTTATMPLTYIGRQVLLHPAIVDTALGCEARLIDQFVDGATSGAEQRATAESRIMDQTALYTLAWAVQFKNLDDTVPPSTDGPVADKRANIRAQLPDLLQDQRLAEDAAQVFAKPDAWSNRELSPVTTKTAFFDKALVAEIGTCLKTNRDLVAFKACVAKQKPDADYVQSLAWLVAPPHLRPESGVRELPYEMTDDLDFLDLHRPHAQPLWPFDFMLQITFESPPAFGRDNEDGYDKHPFEFPSIKPWIHQAVANAITSPQFVSMDAARVLADLREFTVLQRFFRLALAGDLGSAFPVERLVELAKVSPHIAPVPVRTLRWNIFSPDQRAELIAAGRGALLGPLGYDRDYKQFLHDGDRCPAIQP